MRNSNIACRMAKDMGYHRNSLKRELKRLGLTLPIKPGGPTPETYLPLRGDLTGVRPWRRAS